MNRSQLVKAVSESTSSSRRTVEDVVDSLFDTIVTEVRSGRKVTVIGFGAFNPTARGPRVGRNPRTGAVVPIPASKGVRFATGSTFKSALNPKEGVSMAVKKAAAKRAVRKAPAKKTSARKATAKKAVKKAPAARPQGGSAPPRRLRPARRQPGSPRPSGRRSGPPRRLRPARPQRGSGPPRRLRPASRQRGSGRPRRLRPARRQPGSARPSGPPRRLRPARRQPGSGPPRRLRPARRQPARWPSGRYAAEEGNPGAASSAPSPGGQQGPSGPC